MATTIKSEICDMDALQSKIHEWILSTHSHTNSSEKKP